MDTIDLTTDDLCQHYGVSKYYAQMLLSLLAKTGQARKVGFFTRPKGRPLCVWRVARSPLLPMPTPKRKYLDVLPHTKPRKR